MAKNKHLTAENRMQIEYWLKERISLKQIASRLGKSTSTISREVRAKAVESNKCPPYSIRNRCEKRTECDRRYLCYEKPNCIKKCSLCKLCNEVCEDYVEEICYKLYEAPYCCNGCPHEFRCVLKKKYYINRKAQESYRETLTESRTGANIEEGELTSLDEFLSPLILRGQSIHHIVANNPDQFNVSEKTLYRYVSGSMLSAKNIDMPRVCRIRPRKAKPVEHKIDKACRIGRTYEDFTAFIEHSSLPIVEMDSVIGRIGGKVLLTMLFKSCDFMLAFIRERNTSQSVIEIFDSLYSILGADGFKRLMPVALGDNGSEFSNPKALEYDSKGAQRTRVYYCDPYSAFQKPSVELTHEYIRKILPKGTSFDGFVQSDINLMMSHINSYSREKFNDKPPIDIFCCLYGEDVLEKLEIQRIPPNEILLKPSLLKKNIKSVGVGEVQNG